jgi:transcription initiation factor TFIIIB Brf1 subunit/transcription initiation factor TFIIB
MDLDESTRHDAAQLFWDAHDENLAVGTGLYKIAVACAFIASRRSKTLRDLEEWTEKTGIDKSKLHMLVSLVQRELEVGYEPITPMDYIERELDNFDISERNRERVYELVKLAQEANVHVGKQPQSIVAAAIYLAVDWFTQDEVGEKVGVTRKTIRKSYKQIEAVL